MEIISLTLSRCITVVLAVACVVLAGCSRTSPDEDRLITLFAASSTIEPLEAIVASFEAETGNEVELQFAGTSRLASQIIKGADADIIVSANRQWVEELIERQFVSASSVTISNHLILAYNKLKLHDWHPNSLEELKDERISRIAIADPDGVPAGIYTRNVLNAEGKWEALRSKMVFSPNVRQVLAMVDEGLIPVGFVYASDARIASNVELGFVLDQESTGPVAYSFALTNDGAKSEPAKDLFDQLSSEAANEIWQQFGFQLIE